MDQAAFETMIRAMAAEIPAGFFDGVTEVTVSPRVVPHPDREEIFTLGECIPLPVEAAGAETVQSRIVLYHGSFRALAAIDPAFDWETEAWETLTHELKHHVEWRARRDDLEVEDLAVEANFARQDGEPFDPLFYQGGEVIAPSLFRVDADYFIEQMVRRCPEDVTFTWAGQRYQAMVPPGTTLPAYLAVHGVADAPAGELVVVLQRGARLRDLLRPPAVHHAVVAAQPIGVS